MPYTVDGYVMETERGRTMDPPRPIPVRPSWPSVQQDIREARRAGMHLLEQLDEVHTAARRARFGATEHGMRTRLEAAHLRELARAFALMVEDLEGTILVVAEVKP
jgi:hypothetical protein